MKEGAHVLVIPPQYLIHCAIPETDSNKYSSDMFYVCHVTL